MLQDQFREEVATKQKKGAETVLFLLAWVMLIVFGIGAFLMLTSLFNTVPQVLAGNLVNEAGVPYTFVDVLPEIVLCLAMAACAVLLYLKKDMIRTEYEYTITNAQMDFAAVYNNQKRKSLGTMNLKNISAAGMVASGSFQRYIGMQGVKTSNWFVNRDAQLMYVYFQKNDQRRIIVFEPSEEMVQMIKKVLVPGVWQVN